MKVCRICLSKDGRLYPIRSNGLSSLYYQLTGLVKLEVDVDKGLPQWVCAECGLRLMSYNKLRQKSLRSHQILTKLLDRGTLITEEDINKIDREKNDLQSSLSYSILDQGIVQEYEKDIQETNNIDSKHNLPITELIIDKVDKPLAFKTENDSDAYLSETTFSNTFNNSDCESDVLSDIKDSYPSFTTANSAQKLLETFSSNSSKTCDSKLRLRLKKQLEKFTDLLNKKGVTTKGIKKKVKKDVKRVKRNGNRTAKRTIKEGAKKNADPHPIEDVFTVQTLSLEEQIVEFEKRKYSKNYGDALFKCNDCFKGFNSVVTFARHKLMHSDEWGKIECKICKRRFRSMDTYCCHMKSHKTVYSCKECSFTATQRTLAVQHRQKHKGIVYKCPHCGMEFASRSTYLSHVRIKHVSKFVCEFCGYSFVNAKGVALHKNLKHVLEMNNEVSTDGPTCASCNIRFVTDAALNTHLRVSHPQKFGREKRNDDDDGYGKAKIICELCGVKTADGGAYKYHIRRYHPSQNANYSSRHKPFTCDQCGRVFMTQANLQSHALVHTDHKPFECHDCGKTFKCKNNLLIHMRNVHLPKVRKIFSCTICGREFNDPGNRRRHMLVHSNLRPHTCDICGSSFKTKYEVKVHTKHVHQKQPWPKKREQGSRQGF